MRLLIIISLLVLSVSVQAVALGVSPETLEICMGPGETITGSFYPSTNSLEPLDIEVQISSELDIRADSTLSLTPNDITEYPVYIVSPDQGLYESDVYFCKIDDVSGHTVRQCLKARLLTNVTQDCATSTLSSSNKSLIQLILIAAIVLLSGYWLLSKNK